MASSSIELNGVRFLATKEAARRVSLSTDYVARLARQGKVSGVRSGRTWFVDVDSLERFIAACELEKTTRKQFLKEERDAEQQIGQLVYAIERSRGTFQARVQASMQTCGALTIALLFAVLVFEGMPITTFSSYASVAVSSPSQVADEGVVPDVSVRTDVAATEEVDVAYIADDFIPAPRVFATMWSMHYSTSTAYVRSWFSDPISVVWSGGARGVVVPSGDGTSELPVRFTMRDFGQRSGRHE